MTLTPSYLREKRRCAAGRTYWSAVAGMLFLVLGSVYWGRCYLLSAAFFLLAPLMLLKLSWAPLAFGALWGVSSVRIGLHLRRRARQKKDTIQSEAGDPRSPMLPRDLN
jgi:hypothetical protein